MSHLTDVTIPYQLHHKISGCNISETGSQDDKRLPRGSDDILRLSLRTTIVVSTLSHHFRYNSRWAHLSQGRR